MNVLVTGATGFLGSRTVRWLMDLGYSVTATGRRLDRGAELSGNGAKFNALELAFGSNETGARRALDSLLAKHDSVVHCAALASPWGPAEDFERANVLATQNLIDAIERAEKPTRKIRLIHISTPSIYVDSRSRQNIRESDPLPAFPINDYARTKLAAEAIVDAAVSRGLHAITLRPQGLVGPGDPHIVPRILKLAERGVLPLIGGGKSRIDLTYVDNVAHAIALALVAPPSALGRKFNITNGEPVEIGAAIGELLTQMGMTVRTRVIPLSMALGAARVAETAFRWFGRGKEPPITVYSIYTLGVSRTLSIESAKQVLGYEPIVTMKDALARTADAFRKAKA